MSENVNSVTELNELNIFAKRVLGKALLKDIQTVFQERYDGAIPGGEKLPLKLYIINSGSTPDIEPDTGSPVKSVRLVKRLIDVGYPENILINTQKSKVILRLQLVLIVEFEDGTFDIITLPRNISGRLHYDSMNTKAFADTTTIDQAGVPVIQRQNSQQSYESIVIRANGVNNYSSFEYTVTIPFSNFQPALNSDSLDDPTLQSFILLKNLRYDVDVQDVSRVLTNAAGTESVWTTVVKFSMFEDIIAKIGIDQDILIPGIGDEA